MSILGTQEIDYKANDLLAVGGAPHDIVVRKATPAASGAKWEIGEILIYDEGVATLTGSVGALVDGQTLILSVNGAADDTATFNTADFAAILTPTVAELKAVIEADISGVLVTDLGSGDFTITTTAVGDDVTLQRTGGTVTTLSIGTEIVYGAGTMEVSQWDGTDGDVNAVCGVLVDEITFTGTSSSTVRVCIGGPLYAGRITPTKATVVAAGGTVGVVEKHLEKIGITLKGARV